MESPLKAWIDAALTDKYESLSFIYFLAGKTVSQLHDLSIKTKSRLQNYKYTTTLFLSWLIFFPVRMKVFSFPFMWHVQLHVCVQGHAVWGQVEHELLFFSLMSHPLLSFFPPPPPPPPCRVLFWYLQCSSGLWLPAVMSPHLTPPSLPYLHFIFLPSASLSASSILLHF